MKEIVTPPHLGGHCNLTHTDYEGFVYVIDQFSKLIGRPKTIIDIGCGPAHQLSLMRQLTTKDIKCVGIDGDPALPKWWEEYGIADTCEMILHDFTKGFVHVECEPPRFAWCVEFLEHIEEQYLKNVFLAFKQCDMVVMTHALPGHGGHHHVNEQPEDYWLEKFLREGFFLSWELTEGIRNHSGMVRDFMRNTGKVFIREKV